MHNPHTLGRIALLIPFLLVISLNGPKVLANPPAYPYEEEVLPAQSAEETTAVIDDDEVGEILPVSIIDTENGPCCTNQGCETGSCRAARVFHDADAACAAGCAAGQSCRCETGSKLVHLFDGCLLDNGFSLCGEGGLSAWSEQFKNIPLNRSNRCGLLGDATLSFGGQLRYRYMDEENRLRPGGPARSTYDLWRWRNHLDLDTRLVRGYVEMIDASIFGEEMAPLGIDLNRWDILNAFADFKIAERDGKTTIFRVGRQELLFGKQRLISPLDWSNTRRNFEGFRFSSPGKVWDVDIFITRPVNTATGNGPLSRFDNQPDFGDQSRTLNGVYTTYKGWENNTVDLYWIFLDETEPVAAAADGQRHTFGLRWATSRSVEDQCCEAVRKWDIEIEGAYQGGNDNDATGAFHTVKAGFFTSVLSHTWLQVPWTPKITGLYYWGSGDDDLTDDENNTLSTLFPLGHAYWGLIDNFSGQNLQDFSVQGTVKPTKKTTLLLAWHYFNLANSGDALYNIAGARLGTPGTGNHLGQELDFVATYACNANLNFQLAYFWFGYGEFVDNNLPRDDASQFYFQATLDY